MLHTLSQPFNKMYFIFFFHFESRDLSTWQETEILSDMKYYQICTRELLGQLSAFLFNISLALTSDIPLSFRDVESHVICDKKEKFPNIGNFFFFFFKFW